ncbi:MAG: diguanylate cyclase [Vulcanimicrobiota bacterium]
MITKVAEYNEIRAKLKNYLLIVRWIAVTLGIIMTGFGVKKYLFYELPPILADIPIVLVIVFLLYQATASMIQMKFDDSKVFVVFLVISDVLAGLFMSYYYGLPYFYCAFLVPTMVATLYFDMLFPMVIGILSFIAYLFVNIIPLIGIIQNDPQKDLKLGAFLNQSVILLFSAAAIYLGFKWFIDQQNNIINLVKKSQDEKNILFENHQATQKENEDMFIELNNKQKAIDSLEEKIEEMHGEKQELLEALQLAQHELETLNAEIDEKELQVEYEKHDTALFKNEMAEIVDEYTERLNEKDGIIKSREELIEERDEIIRELESRLASTTGAKEHEVQDLQEKIKMLVGQINHLNTALTARESLFESYSKINRNIEIEATYNSIIAESIKLVPSQTAILFIREQTESGPVFAATTASTPYSNFFVNYNVPPGDGPVGVAAETRKPVKINTGDLEIEGKEISTLVLSEKSALVIPLISGDETIGVIYLGKPQENAYVDRDTYLMQSFCKLAVPSIKTAMAFDKATQVMMMDEETGLYNETYFKERIREEAARSIRHNIPISLVLIEIENYEQFAEKADEKTMKKLISDLSEILLSNTRETDLPTRLSPNQFAILFVHAQKKDAILVAERIRMSAEMRSFGMSWAKEAGLHMSIGLAAMPEDSQELEDLYNKAIDCLEEAGEKGGNQTIFVK